MSPRIKIPFIIGTYPIQDVVSEQSQLNTDEINDSDSIDASSTELINFGKVKLIQLLLNIFE